MSDPSVAVEQVAAPTHEPIRLFDEYRAHYGELADPAGSEAWLRRHISAGALVAFVAHRGGEAVGIAIVAPSPASLRLGHFWQIRDLFVAPDHRRVGVAEALLDYVREAALADGATRLALATEADNVSARDLYVKAGFEQVDGYISMMWPLT